MVKENIEQMIKSITQGDTESAKEQFSYVITQKVADRLEDYKTEIGSSFMNQKGDE